MGKRRSHIACQNRTTKNERKKTEDNPFDKFEISPFEISKSILGRMSDHEFNHCVQTQNNHQKSKKNDAHLEITVGETAMLLMD